MVLNKISKKEAEIASSSEYLLKKSIHFQVTQKNLGTLHKQEGSLCIETSQDGESKLP